MKDRFRPRPHIITKGPSSAKKKDRCDLTHEAIMVEEVITRLAIKKDGIYVDATFGRGGHSRAILKCLSTKGQLLAIDRDSEAIQAAQQLQDKRFKIRQGALTNLKQWIAEMELVGKINGILLDLGVSSPQLDNSERGFSFLQEGPLDMRMDQTQKLNARDWVNSAPQAEIAKILKEYGEERYSNRIARAIVEQRNKKMITTTTQLAQIVLDANPRWEKHKHPATRTFQAIRIFINDELNQLCTFLEHALAMLAISGRLVTISFHSLEDRIIKEFINKYSKGEPALAKIPLAESQLNIRLKKIGKVLYPSEKEIKHNPRARSARLRTVEKTK